VRACAQCHRIDIEYGEQKRVRHGPGGGVTKPADLPPTLGTRRSSNGSAGAAGAAGAGSGAADQRHYNPGRTFQGEGFTDTWLTPLEALLDAASRLGQAHYPFDAILLLALHGAHIAPAVEAGLRELLAKLPVVGPQVPTHSTTIISLVLPACVYEVRQCSASAA
jgi:hypothetical protein